MNESSLCNLFIRLETEKTIDAMLRDDVAFLNNSNIKKDLIQLIYNSSLARDSRKIRSIPVLTCANFISSREKRYIESLLKYSLEIEETTNSNTRFFQHNNDKRRIQNTALMKANNIILQDSAICKELWKRLISRESYWKQYNSFSYRFTAEDFFYEQFGTCLDTALIASDLLEKKGMENYIINIRGVYSGHSIVVLYNDNRCISNFNFRDNEYLNECLNNYDIDSIIVRNREYWFEDIDGSSILSDTLIDLAKHGKYRFYCKKIKASLPFSILMNYLDSCYKQ